MAAAAPAIAVAAAADRMLLVAEAQHEHWLEVHRRWVSSAGPAFRLFRNLAGQTESGGRHVRDAAGQWVPAPAHLRVGALGSWQFWLGRRAIWDALGLGVDWEEEEEAWGRRLLGLRL